MINLDLYLVTDRPLCLKYDIEEVVLQAVKGGVTIVQLREKNCGTLEFIDLAKRLKKILTPFEVPLLINDRVDVALAADADGVHLGQSDMSYFDARRILGKDKIIGLSAENQDQVLQLNNIDVDYIAVSPIFSTATKTDTKQPFGYEGTEKAVRSTRHKIVAIGGINLSNISGVIGTGLDGAAVVSAICSADNPCKAAADLKREIINTKKNLK